MDLEHDENNDYVINRFETMLNSNDVQFFDADEFQDIIEHYLDMGKIVLARRALKMSLNQHPSNIDLKLLRVEINIFDNKLELAEEQLNEIYELEPHNEEVYIQKANILSKKDNHIAAIDVLMTGLQYSEDESELYNLIGMEYLFLDDYHNAKFNFMKCLEVDEMDYAALHNIMYCFDFLKENQQAIDFLNMYLNKHPYSEVAWHQIGKQYFDLREYKKALTAFDFAIISDDYFLGAYMEKGKVLEKLDRHEEAIENYRITMELDDPTSFAMLRTGKCHEKLGNLDQALTFFKLCIKEDPLLDKGWIAVTDYYARKMDFQKALYYICKAIDIDAENVLYWKRYAKINHRLNFLEEADRGYRRSMELGNYELETFLNRCDIQIQLDEMSAALLTMERASDFFGNHVEIEFRKCGLHFTLGNAAQGHFYLQNALKSNDEFMIILEELFPTILLRPGVKMALEHHQELKEE